MSFLAPLYLVAAGALAAGVVALHYIVMRQPPSDVLPTARFVPMRPAVVRTWARRPEHLLLLAIRTLAVLLIGTAFARPVWHRDRVRVARVVLADRSRAVGSIREVLDSARGILTGAHDVLIAFDSAPAIDSTLSPSTSPAPSLSRHVVRGNISAALIAGLRAATRAQAVAESIEVVLVSPALPEEVDAATDSIRARWPGAVRWVRVAAHRDSAAAVASRLTLVWPDSALARRPIDTTSAVVTAGAVVIAPFERRWAVDTGRGLVVARWVDGQPAAVEESVTGGCVRHVVVPVPGEGDLTLRPEFSRFARLMHLGCGMADQHMGGAWQVDSGRPLHVAARLVPADIGGLMAWLLGAAILLLLIELGVRR